MYSVTREEALLCINKCKIILLIGDILGNLIWEPLTWGNVVRSKQILPVSVFVFLFLLK